MGGIQRGIKNPGGCWKDCAGASASPYFYAHVSQTIKR